MPSPIAHFSLIIFFRPNVRHGGGWTGWRRATFVLGIVFALMAPDIDVLFGLLAGECVGMFHNGFTHSLFCAIIFAAIFAIVGRMLWPLAWVTIFRYAMCAYCSHVIMDALVWNSRGVQMFWPLTGVRVVSPIPIFLGVRHSVGAPVWVHLVTAGTELLFAVAVWLVCRMVRDRSRACSAGAANGEN